MPDDPQIMDKPVAPRSLAAGLPAREDPLWYKDAVIYQLHIKAFFDSNNDGIGDFAGLTQKLDYLQELGVTAIWLLPFYPSPLRDDGYDISDYRGINPSYGMMRDFKIFVRECHARGLRVITELIINHTSDQHPWFQRARRAKKGSNARNFYVWSDDDKKWPETRIIFTDTEVSNWSWDPVAQQYYWHRFFSHQPDLNFDNPRVVNAVVDIMRFWLDMGVDGLRLDAIPYLVERDGTNNENLPETHAILKRLRAAMDESHPHAFFLAEANQWPEDTLPYFGDGDECQMAFHFPLMPRMYMAMAQEDRHPITDIMRQTPEIPANCQWAIFLRNHDELTLEMVTDKERDYLWNVYAADKRMRINLGIRRRLAPLMDNDRRKIELLNSLLFSMPGTPIIYYGDEIGMGDNVFLGDRDGVRTPMQWSPDRNGGFSKADPARLYLPSIMDPIYGYGVVNVEAQSRSPSSLLNWMKRMVAVRQQRRAFGRGTLRFLYPGNRKILAYLREYEGETILCVANLSRSAQAVELDLSRFKDRVPVELVGRSPFPPIGDLPYLLTLPGYGFYWFVLTGEVDIPSWHETVPDSLPEFVTLVMRDGWRSIVAGRAGTDLAADTLPAFVAKQRWFGAKDARIEAARLGTMAELPGEAGGYLLATVDLSLAGQDAPQSYFVPLAVSWDEAVATSLLPYTLARARRGPRLGSLCDAIALESFVRDLVNAVRRGGTIKASSGSFVFTGGDRIVGIEPASEVRRLGVEQSNSSVLIGDQMILKIYRRLVRGEHPELEMTRFLTEVADFRNTPALLGSVEHVDEDGVKSAMAIIQQFVRNQGDGWTYTTEYLERELEETRLGIAGPEDGAEDGGHFGLYLSLAGKLGQRTAEMHKALSIVSGDPAFDPEPITADDLAHWREAARAQVERAFGALEQARTQVPAALAPEVSALLARRRECLDVIEAATAHPVDAAKIRHHGDYHLGQVLLVQHDFHIIDFEGEPSKDLAQRRAKHCALRDVAGMLRSFNYAAWSTILHFADHEPNTPDALVAGVTEWERLAANAFWATYRETVAGSVSYPKDEAAARHLLDLFIMEKACYEIVYEAANRPHWLGIPVKGVTAILDLHTGGRDE